MWNTFEDPAEDVTAREAYMEERFDVPVDGCLEEFGPHTDHSECAIIMERMNSDDVLDYVNWEAEAYNREAEEDMLGRPLFPNEY